METIQLYLPDIAKIFWLTAFVYDRDYLDAFFYRFFIS